MLSLKVFSMESNIVNTDIIENMPMVIPDNDKMVRILLLTIAFNANKKLSTNSLKKSIIILFYQAKIAISGKYKYNNDLKTDDNLIKNKPSTKIFVLIISIEKI